MNGTYSLAKIDVNSFILIRKSTFVAANFDFSDKMFGTFPVFHDFLK